MVHKLLKQILEPLALVVRLNPALLFEAGDGLTISLTQHAVIRE